MDDPLSTYIILIILCLLFSAFFSGVEIAFISASSLKIELDKKRNKFSGKLLSRFIKKPSQFIGVMLLGNNLALVLYGIFMGELIMTAWLDHYGLSETSSLLIQTLISTAVVLVFAEFIPKAMFRINPNRSLSLFALPITIIYYLLIPVSFLIITLTEWLLKLFFKIDLEEDALVFGKIDLEDYLNDHTSKSTEKGEEIEHEVQIFQNALSFADTKARDCMIPRNEIIALEVDTSIEELKQIFIETGKSKILIYRDNIDNIIGYTHSYEIFKSPKHIKSILLPIHIIPESITVNKVMEQLLKKNRSIAIVVDEFGGTSGMITMEDIIEEIFGEIEDEHDSEDLYEKLINDNEIIVSGRLEIDYLNEKHNLNLPVEEEYETLAGLVLHKTEDIPEINEVIELDKFKFEILEVNNAKIDLIKITIKEG